MKHHHDADIHIKVDYDVVPLMRLVDHVRDAACLVIATAAAASLIKTLAVKTRPVVRPTTY